MPNANNQNEQKVNKFLFTFNYEAGNKEDSLHPHFPANDVVSGKNVGVTIGAGLDMGQFKTPDQAKEYLTGIGFREELVDRLSESAGLKGGPAKEWVEKHSDLSLDRNELVSTFNNIAADREKDLANAIRQMTETGKIPQGTDYYNLPLHTQEAFFDIHYNVGNIKEYPNFTNAYLNGDYDRAVQESLRHDSAHKPLEDRNAAFKKEFLDPYLNTEKNESDKFQNVENSKDQSSNETVSVYKPMNVEYYEVEDNNSDQDTSKGTIELNTSDRIERSGFLEHTSSSDSGQTDSSRDSESANGI